MRRQVQALYGQVSGFITVVVGGFLRARLRGRSSLFRSSARTDGDALSTSGESSSTADSTADSTDTSSGVAHEVIDDEAGRSFKEVPYIGERWRWYDIPYRVLALTQRQAVRKFFPSALRRQTLRGMNYLATFNHFDRTKIERNRFVQRAMPGDEKVEQGAIWVVEFFPPSQYEALKRQLRRNGWDKGGNSRFSDESNVQAVDRARTGQGFLWSVLGAVVSPTSQILHPYAKRETLPAPFAIVDLQAVQLGSSLTAVVAAFRLNDEGSNILDSVWHAKHEPRLRWKGLRPRVEDRYFATLRASRVERQRLHDEARGWLAEQCAGFFATTKLRQPVMDLNIFKYHDPELGGDGKLLDAYRALGLDGRFGRVTVSPEAPGFSFVEVDGGFRSTDGLLENCWGVVGAYERVIELNFQGGYGEKPWKASTFALALNDEMRAFLLYMAALAYLRELKGIYARSRDAAREHHGRYRLSRLKQLRSELLTTSLDLSVVAKDTRSLWEGSLRVNLGINLVQKDTFRHPSRRYVEDEDLVEVIGDRYRDGMDDLVLEDAAYRDVLVTVAALGTSAESSKLGRAALFVSGISLVVAVVTLLLADTGGVTLWSDWLRWLDGR